MLKEIKTYMYPAVYYKEGKYFNLSFVDLEEAYTFSDSMNGLIKEAQEVLSLTIEGRLEDNEDIPEPTKLSEVELKENQFKILVEVTV